MIQRRPAYLPSRLLASRMLFRHHAIDRGVTYPRSLIARFTSTAIAMITAASSLPFLAAADAAEPAKTIDFNRDVRPILSDNCFFCHGPDETTREAGLRLDVREDAIDYAAIVPDDPRSSEMVRRIHHDDPELLMPPPESHKRLTAQQKRILEQWIEEGAAYQTHWSFTPIQRPDQVLTKIADDSGATPIDAMIKARLAEHGSDLSPPAEPNRLIRRLHLDLIGLPPTWQDVQAFTAAYQSDPQAAIQDAIDRLFASPHYGERMASFWLDIARYADTVGFHGDQKQNVFPYRDWVVKSFNDNLPFDEFTIKQLAGDLLPQPTNDDLVASAFNRLNMMTREGGAQPGEYLAKYAADRVRTVGMAWLGLTTGCAECHDHKFDPFTTKDFYSLAAYFADLEQWGVYSNYGYTPNPDLQGFNNDYPFPPEIELVSKPLLREQSQYRQQMLALSTSVSQNALATFSNRVHDFLSNHPSGWQEWSLSAIKTRDDSKPSKNRRWLVDNKTDEVRSIRITLPSSANEPPRDLRFTLLVRESTDQERQIKVVRSLANRFLPDFSGGQVRYDLPGRWKTPATDAAGAAIRQRPHQYLIDQSHSRREPNRIVLELDETLTLKPDERLILQISGLDDRTPQLEVAPWMTLRPLNPATPETLATADAGDAAMRLTYALTHRHLIPSGHDMISLLDRYRRCRDGWTFCQVSASTEPREVRILPRGDWQNQTGELVQPAPPQFLVNLMDDASTEAESTPDHTVGRQTRLDLARWLVAPDHPLTSRVIVNRLWKQFFGSGLTIAADDLGTQGDPPSHPAVLDYLAAELIDSDWDLRHVIRLILSSRVYQQDSRVVRSLQDIDPENRLLAYHPPRRLEAEIVRDNALAVSGLLNLELGGPPIKPYQPVGYYANLQFPNRVYSATFGQDQYRRGLYMHWQRTFPHPMLANFDAPSREDCVALRAKANTPQQALTLLNDPTFIEAAGQLAVLAMQQPVDDAERIRWIVRRVLAREPSRDETTRLLDFLEQRQRDYANASDDVERLIQIGQAFLNRDWRTLSRDDETINDTQTRWAAWTATARVVLNLHETITRY